MPLRASRVVSGWLAAAAMAEGSAASMVRVCVYSATGAVEKLERRWEAQGLERKIGSLPSP